MRRSISFLETDISSCKLMTKYEAAEAMIELLSGGPPVSSRNDDFFDAVEALNTLCTIKKLSVPIYEIKKTGPPNALTFIAICIVSAFREEVFGSSEKEAKQKAAKEMLEKIRRSYNVPRRENRYENKEMSNKKLHERMNLICDLSYHDEVSECYGFKNELEMDINFGRPMSPLEDYQKRYNENNRFKALFELYELESSINDAGESVTQQFMEDSRKKFIDLLKLLDFKYESSTIETMNPTRHRVLVKIYTSPDIAELGCAKTPYGAEVDGIMQLVQLLIDIV